jgi:ABC-type Fe3+-siderophore transport system permease subunit
MDVDIRIPIGLLFAILGLILVLFGLYSMNDADLYARSLGRNINLWTGLVMLLFGGLMLFFTLRKKKSS